MAEFCVISVYAHNWSSSHHVFVKGFSPAAFAFVQESLGQFCCYSEVWIANELTASECKENLPLLLQLASQSRECDSLPLKSGVNFFQFGCFRYAKFSSFIIAAAEYLVVTGSQRWASRYPSESSTLHMCFSQGQSKVCCDFDFELKSGRKGQGFLG